MSRRAEIFSGPVTRSISRPTKNPFAKISSQHLTMPKTMISRNSRPKIAQNRPKSTRTTSKRPIFTIRGARASKQSLVRVIKKSKAYCHKNPQRRNRFRFSGSSNAFIWRPKITPSTARSFHSTKDWGLWFLQHLTLGANCVQRGFGSLADFLLF